jgi:putative spermidine/putrescine transport system substrate-binding protein
MKDSIGKGLTITRRTALMGMATAGAALYAPALVRAATKQMVMATGGGKLEDVYRKTVYEPWKTKTGTEIITTANEGARLKSMVEQKNVQWDIIQGPAEALVVYGRNGLLEPIDYSIVDKSKMMKGTAHDTFVVTDLAAYCVAWNTQNVKSNPPKDWSGLFAHDGRVSLWKKPFQTLEAALLADGVPADKLYPLDLDRAFASLNKIKSKLVWWNSGAQGAQLLIDGEVDAGSTWNGRVYQPKLSGAPVDYTLNQAVLVSDAWGVPKGAPHKEEAMKLIAFELSAKVQADFAEAIPYGPVNPDALPLIADNVKKSLPTLGGNSVLLDVAYWAEHGDKVVERFNTWLLS